MNEASNHPTHAGAAGVASSVVYNLDTGDEYHYSLGPLEALRACHAQTACGDFNTWGYGERYADLPVTRGNHTISCGPLSVALAAPPNRPALEGGGTN